MSSAAKDVFFQTLKYGNIILTGLILAYPKKFFNLVYTKCKRPSKAQVSAAAQQQDQLSQLRGEVKDDVFLKFKAACKVIKKEQGADPKDQLQLYGLYKQVIVGDCNIEQPSNLNYEAKLKYEHWTKFKGLSREDAMMLYVEYVLQLLPKYTEYIATSVQRENDSQQDDSEEDNNISEKDLFESDNEGGEEEEQDQSQKIGRGFGLAVSKMTNNIGEEFIGQKEDIEVTQEAEAFFSLLDDQNVPEIERSINNGFNLLSKNRQGTTALHYCIENELLDTFHTLLQSFPDINAQDSDGFTPIYIAALNEQEDIVLDLLQKGADPFIKDHEGQSAYDQAPSSLKKLIDEHLQQQKASEE